MGVMEPSSRYLAQSSDTQTEVRTIPADWSVKRLESLTTQPATYGVVKAGAFQYAGIPMLRGGDIKGGHINLDLPKISLEKSAEYQRTILRKRDVVIALVGYPGEAAVVPDVLEGANISRAVGLLRPSAELSAEFLVCYLNSPSGRAEFLKPGAGSAQMVVNLRDLNLLLVPLPATRDEQNAIAEALGDADALIESLEQLLAKKRQIKQGAMQELLTGKKRLPGFSGDWVVKRLGELADIRSGGTPSTNQPQFWDGDVPWCTPTDITGLDGFKYLTDTSRKISMQGLKSSSAEMVPAQSIVMTSRATIGECAINKIPVSTNQGFKNFVPFETVDVEFLYYLLLTQKQGFVSLCGGSTFLEIGKSQLAIYEVRIPEMKSEQTAVATVLSDMDAEIAALEAKLAKARSLKQGMMQELLTGRIRLINPAKVDSL